MAYNPKTLAVIRGGTSRISLTAHNLIIGNGASLPHFIAPSSLAGIALVSQGAASDPFYGTVNVVGGGTGNTLFTPYGPVVAASTTTGALSSIAPSSTAGVPFVSAGASANPAFGTAVVAGGGTGSTSFTTYGPVVAASTGTGALTSVAPSATSGVPLISQGASSNPAFGTAVVGGGGTGITSATAYAVLTGGTTSTGNFQSVASVGTSGQVLTSNGAGMLPTFQTAAGNSLAILGYYGGNATNVTGDGTVYTMIFDGASLNRGSYYNTGTGQISVPSSSMFMLSGTITLLGVGVAHTTLHLRFNNGAGDIWEQAFLNPSLLAGAASPNWYTFPFSTPCTLVGSTTYVFELIVSGGTKTVSVVSSGASTIFGMFGPI